MIKRNFSLGLYFHFMLSPKCRNIETEHSDVSASRRGVGEGKKIRREKNLFREKYVPLHTSLYPWYKNFSILPEIPTLMSTG